jgi:aminoglycoside/choline kinase family phosphotransferase
MTYLRSQLLISITGAAIRLLPKSHDAAAVPQVDDLRLEQLRQWLTGLFGSADFNIAPASADASFRRYFRVQHQGHTWIAMDAPPEKENIEPYIRVAEMLAAIGVNAPRIMHRDLDAGFLLNSDLGSRMYLGELQHSTDADRLYHDALAALICIQSKGQQHAAQLPPYDGPLLQREMALFTDWFCVRHLGLQFTASEARSMQEICDFLMLEALAQPRVFVHRDYHSRNLMVCDPQTYASSPGILDFQDAVLGPVTYDLVSLLRDCYIAWPLQRVHGWVERYRGELQAAGVACEADSAQFLRWFDLMGVQRHMKAIGIFARLWHRDGKPGYLHDIPRTLGYVRAVAEHYPQLRFLERLIESRVVPVLESAAAAAGVRT